MTLNTTPTPMPLVPTWDDPLRQQAFTSWLEQLAPSQGLQTRSVRVASADASFRRYFRVDSTQGTRIIMDAPPAKENSRPFVHIAALMLEAGLLANKPASSIRAAMWTKGREFSLAGGASMMMRVPCVLSTRK